MRLPPARRTAFRFVAGEQLEDALKVVAELNEGGMLVTLDLLGEHTEDAAAAEQSAQNICAALEGIAANQLRSGISLKLTQIGLQLDEGLCAGNLETILKTARQHGIFVRVDTEDSPWLEATLGLVRGMHEKGYENVGAVIQSYLYRSDGDVAALAEEGITIRLVKGAYKEPPEIAYPKKADVDAAFDRQTEILLKASKQHPIRQKGDWPPLAAIATHDEARVRFAEQCAEELGLDKQLVEFQMLYGIRRELQRDLAARGYPVRVYVPFGTQWYPYFMRRLAERPANLWFFVSNLVRR
jgi:proline dehydrogenase